MSPLTKSDLIEIFKEYGVVSKKDMPNLLQEYGVVSKKDMPNLLQEYGVATKTDLHGEIIASEARTDVKLKKLERSLTIKMTKSKNDLADRIANVAMVKAQSDKVQKIENRVQDIETFIYA